MKMKSLIKVLSYLMTITFLLFIINSCEKDDDSPVKGPTDIEGYTYPAVKIGNQIWMAENLKTTKYNDGTDISDILITESIEKTGTAAYGWYTDNKDTAFAYNYNALYNFYAVNTGKLCPSGWHVPTDSEWKEFELSIGIPESEVHLEGYHGNAEANKIKKQSSIWYDPYSEITNSTGFSALPGGYCYNGKFDKQGFKGFWWTSSEESIDLAWYRGIDTKIELQKIHKTNGFSVRCIKD